MAFDGTTRRVVLFGGRPASGLALNDTWEWDGVTWSQRTPIGPVPAPRSRHAMAGDPGRLQVVLFGGRSTTGLALGDTWEWNGNGWSQRPAATSPPAVERPAMAYDARRQRVVLFGGNDGFSFYPDVWAWNGAGWQYSRPPTTPPVRAGHAMAYDVQRDSLVVHGGQSFVVSSAMADTWLLDTRWPASVLDYGPGCNGSAGLPVLTSSDPYVGNRGFALHLLSARPASPALIAFSRALVYRPLPGGCTLYLGDTAAVLFATTRTGSAVWHSAIAATAALHGITVYAQAAVLDPAAAGLGIAFSSSRELFIGE
jgi:hypothetical protein